MQERIRVVPEPLGSETCQAAPHERHNIDSLVMPIFDQELQCSTVK